MVDNTASLRLESIVPSVHWLQSATEVETWRSRQKQLEQECRTRAKAVLSDGNCGLMLAGHSFAEYNGTYEAVDERDGWPVLRNEHGRWLYRPSQRQRQQQLVDTVERAHSAHRQIQRVHRRARRFVSCRRADVAGVEF